MAEIGLREQSDLHQRPQALGQAPLLQPVDVQGGADALLLRPGRRAAGGRCRRRRWPVNGRSCGCRRPPRGRGGQRAPPCPPSPRAGWCPPAAGAGRPRPRRFRRARRPAAPGSPASPGCRAPCGSRSRRAGTRRPAGARCVPARHLGPDRALRGPHRLELALRRLRAAPRSPSRRRPSRRDRPPSGASTGAGGRSFFFSKDIPSEWMTLRISGHSSTRRKPSMRTLSARTGESASGSYSTSPCAKL